MKLLTAHLLLVALSPMLPWAAAAGQCSGGRTPVADLGIGIYHCVAGHCGIYDGRDRRYYTFSVEPQIWKIRKGGPGDGLLRDRDVIVSVNGQLVTSREGGRALANLPPGTPVRLTVRRDGTEREVTIEPASICAIPMLIWTRDPTTTAPELRRPPPPAAPSTDYAPEPPAPPTATLGLRVSCTDCGWYVDPEGILLWKSASLPVILEIEPDGPGDLAGLRPGDTITHLDGHSILSASGGRRLATLAPDDRVVVTYLRDGRPETTVATAVRTEQAELNW
jgi:S1-C subfamily serine protease